MVKRYTSTWNSEFRVKYILFILYFIGNGNGWFLKTLYPLFQQMWIILFTHSFSVRNAFNETFIHSLFLLECWFRETDKLQEKTNINSVKISKFLSIFTKNIQCTRMIRNSAEKLKYLQFLWLNLVLSNHRSWVFKV